MNYHCWRNARSQVNSDDDRTWPKLPHTHDQERTEATGILGSRMLQLSEVFPSGSEEIDPEETLNDMDYPRIGEIVLRKKRTFVENNRMEMRDTSTNQECRKLRRLRSTDVIHVNLQKALERQRWPLLLHANQPTKITVDICKLNVNMSVGSPYNGGWLLTKSKRGATHIGKKKKPSRLKWFILYERMIRKYLNANVQRQICDVSSSQTSKADVSGIRFENLRIDVLPRDDMELLRKMNALSCLNTNYRDTSHITITEDTVTFRPDLHEQMENMTLETKVQDNENDDRNVPNVEFIDADTIDATLGLKICNETGEFNDTVNIKEESSRINFTKKFREYCTNTVTAELKKCLEELLSEISRLQKKLYERDNVKGKSKRRYYAGIKEVQKHIDLKKIKLVIIAPDLEKVKIEGGLDDAVVKLMGNCKRNEVPYCFGLGRRQLGYCIHGRGLVSCIGIANYSGAEEKLKDVLVQIVEARNEFSRLISDDPKTIDVDKFLPKEELLLSEMINAYFKIIASTS